MTRGNRGRTAANVLMVISLTAIALLTLEPGRPRPRPAFWCLWCGRHVLLDLILNVVLFMPLGAALRMRGFMMRRAALTGFVISTTVELAQYWIPGREPSARDIATNTIGALLGALLVARLRERENGMFLPLSEPRQRSA
jgi:VanZ family protein